MFTQLGIHMEGITFSNDDGFAIKTSSLKHPFYFNFNVHKPFLPPMSIFLRETKLYYHHKYRTLTHKKLSSYSSFSVYSLPLICKSLFCCQYDHSSSRFSALLIWCGTNFCFVVCHNTSNFCGIAMLNPRSRYHRNNSLRYIVFKSVAFGEIAYCQCISLNNYGNISMVLVYFGTVTAL